MEKYARLCVSLAAVVLAVVVVEAAVIIIPEPCPDGVSNGTDWNPDLFPGTNDTATCMKCSCNGDSYTCYTCGVIALSNPACRLELKFPDSSHPECCEVDEVCPDDS